jgi:hypothetical protein
MVGRIVGPTRVTPQFMKYLSREEQRKSVLKR